MPGWLTAFKHIQPSVVVELDVENSRHIFEQVAQGGPTSALWNRRTSTPRCAAPSRRARARGAQRLRGPRRRRAR
ncbi:hypothetical protein [Arthrobacter dokdonensis]|uniref:hypothetical protein n=1 Tax=Arthrobacter dokdonellae TaxID=2211210 RepID=UPI001D131C8F